MHFYKAIPVEDTPQKRMDSMELSWMSVDVCQTCKDSKAIIFDAEANETVCSSCGIVLRDNVQASPQLRARKYSQEDIESRGRTGMPTSLAFHDMGLSTFISNSNMDAFTATRDVSIALSRIYSVDILIVSVLASVVPFHILMAAIVLSEILLTVLAYVSVMRFGEIQK